MNIESNIWAGPIPNLHNFNIYIKKSRAKRGQSPLHLTPADLTSRHEASSSQVPMHIYWHWELNKKFLGSIWLEEWKNERIESDRNVKKWEDRKDFNFPHFCSVGSVKSGEMEKMCLYKFTHIPLLKNDALLKQKSDKKKAITQIY